MHVPHSMIIVAASSDFTAYDIHSDNAGGSFDSYTYEVLTPLDGAFFVRFRDEKSASLQLLTTILLTALLGFGLERVFKAFKA